MPYSERQCKKFAAMEGRGEKCPKDWKKHCVQSKPKSVKKKVKK